MMRAKLPLLMYCNTMNDDYILVAIVVAIVVDTVGVVFYHCFLFSLFCIRHCCRISSSVHSPGLND